MFHPPSPASRSPAPTSCRPGLLGALCLVVVCALLGAAGCERRASPLDPPLDVAGSVREPAIEVGEEQTLTARVTRNGAPARGAIVTINVFLPAGGVRWYIGAPTDAEGATLIRFKASQSGVYFVEVTAQQNGEVVTTNTSFLARYPDEG